VDFALSKELEMLRKAVREFATKKIAPTWTNGMKPLFPLQGGHAAHGRAGLFGTVIPEEYDGEDMGWLAAMIVTEEIARVSSSLRVQINMQTLGCAYTIITYGSED
jgi:glutaryl-CoA dehydrogenase (non-decarboxylating)